MEEIHEHVFEKCYIGFCTPTHTEMDYKKKKNILLAPTCASAWTMTCSVLQQRMGDDIRKKSTLIIYDNV